jgi:shikimate dehydrogenase
MHNAAFKELKLDFEYHVFELDEDELPKFFRELKSSAGSGKIRGLNVTHPYKQKVMEYLDEINDSAVEIGAVNTIINDDGQLIGYNTDSYGALEALFNNDVDAEYLHSGKVLVLGAGGAGRAVVFSLLDIGAKVIIANRTFNKAEQLADYLKNKYSAEIEVIKQEDIIKTLDEVVVVINCTSVGMQHNTNAPLLPPSAIKQSMVVFDIVYNPMNTALLISAKAAGAKIIYGYEMLVYQGALAFELFTGIPAPVEVMREVVISDLGSN